MKGGAEFRAKMPNGVLIEKTEGSGTRYLRIFLLNEVRVSLAQEGRNPIS